jgi:hypothetical protein
MIVKRILAGAVAAVLLSPLTPAQAAPADPVEALQKLYVAGKGVKFTDATSLVGFSGTIPFLKRQGTLVFGGKGIAASDVRATFTPRTGLIFNALRLPLKERTIKVGAKSWLSDVALAEELPKGKSWLRDPFGRNAGFSGWYGQTANAAEPATLKALLAAGSRKGRTYTGSITFAALSKVSPWLRSSHLIPPKGKDKLRFELTLGPNGLPQRLVTSYAGTVHLTETVAEDNRFSTETRYTGWGARTRVAAPPAAQVAS